MMTPKNASASVSGFAGDYRFAAAVSAGRAYVVFARRRRLAMLLMKEVYPTDKSVWSVG